MIRIVEEKEKVGIAIVVNTASIEIHSDRRGGFPVLRGTRIPISQIIAEISDGRCIKDIAGDLEIDEALIREFLCCLSVELNKPYGMIEEEGE